MDSIVSGTNIANCYCGYGPPGKRVILSESIKPFYIEYVVYNNYTETSHKYYRVNNSWKEGTSMAYIYALEQAFNNYKKMIPKWLELYRYFSQFDVGKDIFTNIIVYYIEF